MAGTARVLFILCLACTGANADTPADEKSECLKREMGRGHDEPASKAICSIKRLFQNRIRSKPDEEPVEMTVGSPPMVSDDTDTPGAGNWEVNLVFNAERSSDQRTYEAPLLDMNYGIGDTLQIKYEVPFVIVRQPQLDGSSRTDHGLGDSIVGIKHRFYDNDESGVSLAWYPQIRFRTPGATRAVSEGGSTVILPLLLTREFSNASITADLGVEKSSQDDRPNYFASFGAGTRLNQKVALMAEIAAQDLRDAQDRRVIFNIGLKLKLSEKQSILASLGHDLRSPDGESSNRYATVAYQRFFGD